MNFSSRKSMQAVMKTRPLSCIISASHFSKFRYSLLAARAARSSMNGYVLDFRTSVRILRSWQTSSALVMDVESRQ